ncbi:MAG: hypothetical protein IJX88_06535 [Clostridia bacterium]|nr:hypothetical protein [Clostridia bacterium]
MANEITERNCLEAELVLGYKYYEIKAEHEKKISACQHEINYLNNSLHGDRNTYTARRDNLVGSESYMLSKHPEWNKEYQDYCKKAHDEVRRKDKEQFTKTKTEELNFSKTMQSGSLFLGVVFLFLTVLFNILGVKQFNGDYGKAFQESGWLVAATFMGILAALFLIPFFGSFKSIAKLKEQLANYQSDKQADVMSFEQFVKQKPSLGLVKQELSAAYDTEHAAEIEAFTKKEQEIQAKIDKKNAELCALRETQTKLLDYGERLPAKLKEIPVYYFKQDAVGKMLFFYVNKRADNVRDLINLYETTVFQEAVLKSLKDIAVSVDRLAEAVRGGFTRLGLQLGVVNESIQENTKAQRLNREKLSEIKDENAKHYLEIVDAIDDIELISNTYVTANVQI